MHFASEFREWQLDTVMVLEDRPRDDADVSFRLSFKKARERMPETRADFEDVEITLIDGQWTTSSAKALAGHVSPMGAKFFDALRNATIGNDANKMFGRPAASFDRWKAECVKIGIVDPNEKPDSARALFNKHKRELIAADRIACNDTMVWVLI